jgi:CheY-like chemotaxis protein
VTPQPVGTELALRFSIPGAGPMEVRGVVAWIRPEPIEGKAPGMGVEFEQLDTRHGQIVDGLVASFRGLQIMVVASGFNARAQLARAVRSILSSAEVVEVSNPDAAEAALAREPDLAIVDVDGGDTAEGLYVVRRAKTAHERELPVIALAREDDVRSRARELGADEVLPSPFLMSDLQQSILRALGRPLRVGEG